MTDQVVFDLMVDSEELAEDVENDSCHLTKKHCFYCEML
jgi:hypothetical protein